MTSVQLPSLMSREEGLDVLRAEKLGILLVVTSTCMRAMRKNKSCSQSNVRSELVSHISKIDLNV